MMLLLVVSATQAWGHIMVRKVSANFHMQKLYLFVIGFSRPSFPPSLWNIPTKLAIRFFLKKAIQVLNKDYKKPRNEAFIGFK